VSSKLKKSKLCNGPSPLVPKMKNVNYMDCSISNKYLHFIMGVLLQVEKGDKLFENRNSMANEKVKRGVSFFPFGFWGWKWDQMINLGSSNDLSSLSLDAFTIVYKPLFGCEMNKIKSPKIGGSKKLIHIFKWTHIIPCPTKIHSITKRGRLCTQTISLLLQNNVELISNNSTRHKLPFKNWKIEYLLLNTRGWTREIFWHRFFETHGQT